MSEIQSDDFQVLMRGVGSVVRMLGRLRHEIATLQPAAITQVHIPMMTDVLDTIVSDTADAANTYMDVAEKIGQIAETIENPEVSEQLQDCCMKIYEASSFQDLSGQRINKVITALKFIDDQLNRLVEKVEILGDEVSQVSGTDSLLNGPQKKSEAPTQDKIDDLFSSS